MINHVLGEIWLQIWMAFSFKKYLQRIASSQTHVDILIQWPPKKFMDRRKLEKSKIQAEISHVIA